MENGMLKVLIVNSSHSYIDMYEKKGWTVVHSIKDADLVQFTGGSDVSPNLYGEEKHPTTNNSVRRDHEEGIVYKDAIGLNIPCVGICRGGQFLHVMNGGDLWQDVNGHAFWGTHPAIDVITGNSLGVTSTHHQMMRMNGSKGLVVMKGYTGFEVKEHMAGDVVEALECTDDIEAVYYKETQTFCFQPHPEMSGAPECTDYFFLKLQEFFGLS
jgi:gamma-glutamyl-gamma-aminobutyrate hydrolase PuuD